MQFNAVVLKNFMSYASAEFSDIDRPGLTLIEGRNTDQGDSNGSGKSSIWDAISWGLFGKTIRGVGGDSVINRKFKKNCTVEVKLKSGTHEYKIVRTRKDDTCGNSLKVEQRGTITRDIKWIELGTMDATQEWIIDRFGVDFELFRCTVLFGQGETFNFVDESNGAQKDILSKIMKVNFDEELTKAKSSLKGMISDLAELETKTTVLKSHIKDPTTMFKAEIERWESEKDERMKEVQTETFELGRRYKEIDADLKSKPIERYQDARKKVKTQIEKINVEVERFNSTIADYRAGIKVLEGRIRDCKALTGQETCPLCLNEIDSGRGLQRIKEAEETIESHKICISDLSRKREVVAQNITSYQGKHEFIGDKIAEQEQKARTLTDLGKQIIRLKTRFKEVACEENPFKAKIAEEVEKQARIKDKLEDFATRSKKIKDDQPYYEFWSRAFGDDGIKSFIFDLVCSTLTNRANSYLDVLTGGHIAVSFDTQKKLKSGETREKFECQVVSDGGPVPYENYSGGEKRRVSLAVDMSLADLMSDYHGSKFNMVVFDEQDQYLDNKGRQHYMNLLKKIAKHKRVFVVAHDDQFKAEFDEVITIKKSGGISEVAC